MHASFKLKVCSAIIFFVIMTICAPVQATVNATSNNQMVNDWLQNPENNQDDEQLDEQEQSDQEVKFESQTQNELTGGQGLTAWDYIKMLFSLIFVLGLLLFVLKFINKKSRNYQQNSLVRNIGGVTLGSQKSVQILQVGKSIYIVGVGENVQLIKEIDDDEEIQSLINNFDEKQTFTSTTPYIAELLKKINPKSKSEPKEHNQDSFGEILNKRLTDIKKERRDELEKWKEKGSDE
ncbi:hypothetical protein MTP04_12820 [Lysinibacillus sp. PLM2]|nr:hypothetical protein MTP04_12820 [Lysinibacillus sp. PLM2]